MEATVSLLAKILGAKGVESSGPDARFVVEDAQGGRLKCSINGRTQRFMGALIDAAGITRVSVDVAPVSHVKEDVSVAGRVILQIGKTLILVDSQPTLAIEVVTASDA
jgi:hypothetical protein